MWFEMVAELSFICFLCRIRHMQGLRETQLSADVELLPITETAKQKQGAKPPISLNFEVLPLSLFLSPFLSLSLFLSLPLFPPLLFPLSYYLSFHFSLTSSFISSSLSFLLFPLHHLYTRYPHPHFSCRFPLPAPV